MLPLIVGALDEPNSEPVKTEDDTVPDAEIVEEEHMDRAEK